MAVEKIINSNEKLKKVGEAEVIIELLLDDGKYNYVYTFERKWKISGKKINETFIVYKDGAILSETESLLAYEFTFFIVAIVGLIYVCGIKKEKISLPKEKNRCIAAIFETAGQFFYTYAMASNSTISAALVSSYCILSLLLSRIFLKEHLSWKQYVFITVVFVGIVLTSI